MSLCAWLLENNNFEKIALGTIVLDVLVSLAKLLFQPGNAQGCHTLLLFSPGAEPGRSARIPLSLLVRDLGSRLNIDWNLYVMALLAFYCHNLNAALS